MCILIYKSLVKLSNRVMSAVIPVLSESCRDKKFAASESRVFDFALYEPYLKEPRFLVDNMLKKLCSIMRNCGLDTEYIAVKDYELVMSLASK